MGSRLLNGQVALDGRLQAVADLAPSCASVADIGCDHGYLAAYLLQNGRAGRVVLGDISAPSLEKARRLLTGLGLGDRADFRVGSGAEVLTSPVDCAVFAGMGAALMGGLLAAGKEKLRGARLVLQPNLGHRELRSALTGLGWAIADERAVIAGGRHYVVIAAEPGEASYTPEELLCGPVLLRTGGEALASLAAFQLRVARNALRGAEGADPARAEELRREIAIWEEAAACRQR